jgi:Uma2 family endonuclease
VRIEVEMPRSLYDRLTEHENAPKCRYDMATGRAEFVAEPGPSHEWRAVELSTLFTLIRTEFIRAGREARLLSAAATRLLSADGAFEPDASLFLDLDSALMEWVTEFDGYLDVRKGHPVPDLVVEIDRSADSKHKLAPYFRLGVHEVWTWSRRHGARIWVADREPDLLSGQGLRAADRSRVLPGVGQRDLDRLLATYSPARATRHSLRIAERVARSML